MKKDIAAIGFYAATAVFLAMVGYGIVQILQVAGATRYPLDDILIYGFSLAIAPPFLIAILALHCGLIYFRHELFHCPKRYQVNPDHHVSTLTF